MLREQRPAPFGGGREATRTPKPRVQMADNAPPKNPYPPNTVSVCAVVAQLPYRAERDRGSRINLIAVYTANADMVRAIAGTCRV